VDVDHPAVFEQILRLTGEALPTRRAATYREIAKIYSDPGGKAVSR
jgi:hypothetical protein